MKILCGICGMVGFDDKGLLKNMSDVIVHRGPDDSGNFIDKNVGLGVQRLSIIDIKSGHQPIHNETGSIYVVYNGEIYNFLDLKEELEKLGHKFSTSCDTEVLVHLYEEFGDFFVNKLRGMFAFAIWDSNKKRLLLGRDRLGIKPLYYTIVNGNLLFGSEIKSILQYELIERGVDLRALHNFLTFQYVPGPSTMFKNIKKLQPGHILNYEQGKISISKYWDVKISFSKGHNVEFYTKNLLELLKETVRIRLMSEVPLGVYLSGGLDSSSVAALMSEFTEEPVKTYTVGFGHPTDEFKYARVVADHFGTDHHELVIESEMIKKLPKVVWYFDEPVADPAALPTLLMSEVTKKYVTVVLVGEGGDETFAGYPKYSIALSNKKYRKFVPNFFKETVIPRMSLVTSKIFQGMKLKKYLEFLSEFSPVMDDDAEAFTKMSTLGFNENEKKSLYNNKVKRINFPQNPVRGFVDEDKNLFKGMLLFDMKVWLCDRLLMKVDKMTMANSIEARVPFLDHELVNFCNKMPINLRLKKGIFKKAMGEILPKTILKRGKHGFAVPISSWFERDLKGLTSEILSKLHREEYFKHEYIRKILKQIKKVRSDHKLWNLLVFEIWYRMYIDSDDLRKPELSIDKLLS